MSGMWWSMYGLFRQILKPALRDISTTTIEEGNADSMSFQLTNFLPVALGGALGASARYGVGLLMLRWLGPGYPWGTLTVNVVGGFCMGLLVEAIALRFSISPEMRLLLVTGFLGGFTTFSAFSLEVANMMERNAYMPALGYALGSVLLSVGALFLGLMLGRSLWA